MVEHLHQTFAHSMSYCYKTRFLLPPSSNIVMTTFSLPLCLIMHDPLCNNRNSPHRGSTVSCKGIWRSKQLGQSTTVKCKSIFCGSHFFNTIKMASRIVYALVKKLTGDESVFETKNRT